MNTFKGEFSEEEKEIADDYIDGYTLWKTDKNLYAYHPSWKPEQRIVAREFEDLVADIVKEREWSETKNVVGN